MHLFECSERQCNKELERAKSKRRQAHQTKTTAKTEISKKPQIDIFLVAMEKFNIITATLKEIKEEHMGLLQKIRSHEEKIQSLEQLNLKQAQVISQLRAEKITQDRNNCCSPERCERSDPIALKHGNGTR